MKLFEDDPDASRTPDLCGQIALLEREAALFRASRVLTDVRIQELEAEVARIKEEVIWCFSEDEVPQFIQGYAKGKHEMTEICTADQVNYLVKQLSTHLGKIHHDEDGIKDSAQINRARALRTWKASHPKTTPGYAGDPARVRRSKSRA